MQFPWLSRHSSTCRQLLIKRMLTLIKRLTDYDHVAVEGLIRGRVGADRAAEKANIQQLRGTDEAADRR